MEHPDMEFRKLVGEEWRQIHRQNPARERLEYYRHGHAPAPDKSGRTGQQHE